MVRRDAAPPTDADLVQPNRAVGFRQLCNDTAFHLALPVHRDQACPQHPASGRSGSLSGPRPFWLATTFYTYPDPTPSHDGAKGPSGISRSLVPVMAGAGRHPRLRSDPRTASRGWLAFEVVIQSICHGLHQGGFFICVELSIRVLFLHPTNIASNISLNDALPWHSFGLDYDLIRTP